MSARDPHHSSPERLRIVKSDYPEDKLVACRELGITPSLHEPDLGKTPELAMMTTGDQMRALRKWKRGRYFVGGESRHAECMAWIQRNSELCAAAAESQSPEARKALDEHQGRNRPWSDYRAPRPRGGWGTSEYERRDDAGETCHKFRCYAWDEIVIETCQQRGLRCERVSVPAWDFVILWVWADKREFSAARYDWLSRMIAAMPKLVANDKQQPKEINLFA